MYSTLPKTVDLLLLRYFPVLPVDDTAPLTTLCGMWRVSVARWWLYINEYLAPLVCSALVQYSAVCVSVIQRSRWWLG